MRVGKLCIPFMLQSETLTEDVTLGQVGVWSDVATFWGSLDPLSASDDFTHESTVRARSDLSPVTGMRLSWSNRFFLILDVQKVDEKERWLRLRLREVLELN
ncbi:MAG TPA: hypothetical protein DD400_05495 [Rhodospirillaceae bacterium]|nr:hypothetical protein [Rhodospirillaceae bacterium]